MLCPGDLVYGLNKAKCDFDTCVKIRRKHLADGTSCQWKDEAYDCICGGLNHSSGHHGTFEQEMKDQGISGRWPPVIYQSNVDIQTGKQICMATERGRGGCILPKHEGEFPYPQHISWLDIERTVRSGHLSAMGSLRRIHEECFIHCTKTKQGVIDLEDFILAYSSLSSGPVEAFDRSKEIAVDEQEKKNPVVHLKLRTIPPRSGTAKRRANTPAPRSRSKDRGADSSSSSLRGPVLDATAVERDTALLQQERSGGNVTPVQDPDAVPEYDPDWAKWTYDKDDNRVPAVQGPELLRQHGVNATEKAIADEDDPMTWSGPTGWVRTIYVRNHFKVGQGATGTKKEPEVLLIKDDLRKNSLFGFLEEVVISVKPALALARRTRRSTIQPSMKCVRKLADESEGKNKI